MDILTQWTDWMDALKKRDSFDKFASKFSEHSEAMDTNLRDYQDKLAKVTGPVRTAISELKSNINPLRRELDGMADLTKHGWVPKDKTSKTAFEKARNAYEAANLKLENFLSGAQKHNDVSIKEKAEDIALSDAFKDFRASVDKVRGVMGNPFGMARVNGFKNVGETISHNMKGMRFWEDGVVPAKRAGAVAFRGAVLVGAGAGIADAVLRGRNSDGEERGTFERGAELLASVGAGGAALLFGRAL